MGRGVGSHFISTKCGPIYATSFTCPTQNQSHSQGFSLAVSLVNMSVEQPEWGVMIVKPLLLFPKTKIITHRLIYGVHLNAHVADGMEHLLPCAVEQTGSGFTRSLAPLNLLPGSV